MGFIYDQWPNQLGLVFAVLIMIIVVIVAGLIAFIAVQFYFDAKDKRRTKRDLANYELGIRNSGHKQQDAYTPTTPQVKITEHN